LIEGTGDVQIESTEHPSNVIDMHAQLLQFPDNEDDDDEYNDNDSYDDIDIDQSLNIGSKIRFQEEETDGDHVGNSNSCNSDDNSAGEGFYECFHDESVVYSELSAHQSTESGGGNEDEDK
jgi:hypothetical protein